MIQYDCPDKGLKLYKFFNKKDFVYVFSTLTNVNKIRGHLDNWDHGGMDYELFASILQEGECQQITSVKEIPVEEYGHIPYCTDEKLKNGKYLFTDFDLHDFIISGYLDENR